MTNDRAEIRWEPRVSQQKIRLLYETDARGIYDEELIDDVGFGLLARCQSFLEAEAARRGEAKCHGCGAIIPHDADLSSEGKQRLLTCGECGWRVTWGAYFKTIQKKQLSGPDLESLFRDYVARFTGARGAREKMLLIDRLIHGFHYSIETGPRRPSAVNLIEGRLWEVIEFLNELTYGDEGTPGIKDRAASWRADMNTALRSWGARTLGEPRD
jgi:DNA-directed RNA polymerase subunit RPC12/RpoP